MGANGSTAASCSSLDLSNPTQDRHNLRYYRQQQPNQLSRLQIERLHRYKRQEAKINGQKKLAGKLKHSSSHFDLTPSSVLFNLDLNHHDHQHLQANQLDAHNRQLLSPSLCSSSPGTRACDLPCGQVEDGDASQRNQQHLEAYHLGVSDLIAPDSRPVMVLPPINGRQKPLLPIHLGPVAVATKSNAGVASRILQQRQQQQQQRQRQLLLQQQHQQRKSSELKKFSDSLPSLNNLISPTAVLACNANVNVKHQRLLPCPLDKVANFEPPKRGDCSKSDFRNGLAANDLFCLNANYNQNHPNNNINRQQVAESHQVVNLVKHECLNKMQPPNSYKAKERPIRVYHCNHPDQVGVMMMKRATSLSSLHDSNLAHLVKRPQNQIRPPPVVLNKLNNNYRSSYSSNRQVCTRRSRRD